MTEQIQRIRVLLESAQRKLKDLEKQAVGLRAEITAYEKVCSILAGEDSATSLKNGHVVEGMNTRKPRGLSETWQKVVYWIATQANPPETEHIYDFTQKARLNVVRNTLRSQLSVYTTQGILKRVDGHYVVTPQGMNMLLNQTLDESKSQPEPEEYSSLFSGVPPSEEKGGDIDDDIPF